MNELNVLPLFFRLFDFSRPYCTVLYSTIVTNNDVKSIKINKLLGSHFRSFWREIVGKGGLLDT